MTIAAAIISALFILEADPAANWPRFVLVGVFGVFGSALLLYLLTHPALARRRLLSGPLFERGRQRVIIVAIFASAASLFLVTLLDVRRHWSSAPTAVMLLGDALVGAGLLLVLLVFMANQFAGASVRVEAGQQVISSGPYAAVRHPMYTGLLLVFLGAPLGVGSLWGLAVFPVLVGVFIWRLLDEERYLSANLPGYQEYAARVRRRLVPGVW